MPLDKFLTYVLFPSTTPLQTIHPLLRYRLDYEINIKWLLEL